MRVVPRSDSVGMKSDGPEKFGVGLWDDVITDLNIFKMIKINL